MLWLQICMILCLRQSRAGNGYISVIDYTKKEWKQKSFKGHDVAYFIAIQKCYVKVEFWSKKKPKLDSLLHTGWTTGPYRSCIL